jgi:hypothetical protein
MELATRRMPKLKNGILCHSISGEVWIDVECRKTDDGGRQCEIQSSTFITSSPSPEIVEYLQKSSRRSVLIDEQAVYETIRQHYDFPNA